MSLTGVINQVLGLKAQAPELRAGDIWMRCPFHAKGKERTASFRVSINPAGKFPLGSGHCFGCGYHAQSWTNLAEDLRLKDYEDWDETLLSLDILADATLSDDFTDFHDDEDFIDPVPVTENWRGIGPKMLAKANAQYRYYKLYKGLAVYLPVQVNGKTLGGIYAEVIKTRKNSYMETPGGWKSNAWYLYDYTRKFIERKKLSYVVLVEGPRDALRFCQNGIPAVGMLGASAWSERKGELLDNLPIEKLYTCFDGDEAGKVAAAKVKEMAALPVVNIPLRQDEDPGNMAKQRIQLLKRRLGLTE